MARNGSGTYVRTDGTRTGATVFAQEKAAGINIVATNLDTEAQDMADALTASIAKDGQTTPTANLPMGSFKHTGCADPTAATDYATRGFSASWYGAGLDWHDGLVLSHAADAAHDITVASGRIMDGTGAYMMELGSAMTKRIDATWAAGSTNGGLSDLDTLTDTTWYGIWVLGKSGGAITDTDVIIATTSARSLGDTAAAAFDTSRLVGYVRTYDSGTSDFDIVLTVDAGNNTTMFDVMDNNLNVTTYATSRTPITATVPPFQVGHFVASGYQVDNFATFVIFVNDDQTDSGASLSNHNLFVLGTGTATGATSSSFSLKVNGSSVIQYRANRSGTSPALYVNTVGWTMDYTITDLV